MPTYVRGATTIHYEERGSGFPLLLLAPGGMRSTIEMWANAAIDPWGGFDGFRLIAMDQRNAGRSSGPLAFDDPWGAAAADQLGLLDHLGVDRFLAMGCCIGCSYLLKLAEAAPGRLVAGVLEQPIGLHPGNRALFEQMWQAWEDELLSRRPALDAPAVRRFLDAMWAADFVVSVARSAVEACAVPLLVLPGIDDFHPTETGREVAALAPHAATVEPWKDSPEHVAAATGAVLRFLRDHTPAG